MSEPVAYTEVIQAYADSLGRSVETLTDAEKKQAFLNAVLSGARVEPFATWCDLGQAALDDMTSKMPKAIETLAAWIERQADGL